MDLETGASDEELMMNALPSFLKPQYPDQLLQMLLGTVTVVGITAFLLFLTYAVTLNAIGLSPAPDMVCRVAMNSYAIVALGCLAKIVLGDAGQVERSAENCLPIPGEVRMQLLEAPGEPLQGLTNSSAVIATESGVRSYCVRCCVWRSVHAHHCRICHRCVVHFDHHCGVFGRCIAGKLGSFNGNFTWFVLIIAIGSLAYATAFGFMGWAMWTKFA